MRKGILYIVFNNSIRDPESNELLYKIGYTKKTVEDRYYGIGLKMPGIFKKLLEFNFEDCVKAEKVIHNILEKKRINGEWFKISDKDIELIKNVCKTMGAKIVNDITEINNESFIEIDRIFDNSYKETTYENVYVVKENGEDYKLNKEEKKQLKKIIFRQDFEKYKNEEFTIGKDENGIIHAFNDFFPDLTLCIENPDGTLVKGEKWIGKVKEINCKKCLDSIIFFLDYWNSIGQKR